MRNLICVWCLSFAVASLSAEEPKIVYKSEFEKELDPEIWPESSTINAPADGKAMLGEFGFYGRTPFHLSKLPPHRYLRFKAKLYMIRTLDGNSNDGTTDFWTAIVHGKGSLMITTFANSNQGADGRKQAWPDEIPAANHPPTTGASQTNSLGFTVDQLQGAVIDSTYEISMSFPHSGADLYLELGSGFSSSQSEESWAISDVVVEAFDQPAPLPEEALEKLWKDISGKDPGAAHKAVWTLVEQGDTGTKFVDKKLRERANGSKEEFAKLLAALDSDAFVERQQATAALRKRAASFRPLIIAQLKLGEVNPNVRAALNAAFGQTRKDLLSSRVARLMRVSAFEPGWALEQQKRLVKAANSSAKADGSYRLLARHAKIKSTGPWPRFRNNWDLLEDVDPGVSLDWTVSGIKAGKYKIQIDYACFTPGSRIEMVVGGSNIFDHTIESTGDWLAPQTFDIGEITVDKDASDLDVNVLAAEKGSGYGFFNPAGITLKPIK